jgi:glycosyltransferase involved in cell wall biosynthesis
MKSDTYCEETDDCLASTRKAFCAPNIKCLVLSRYGRLGASSRVRFYQYLPYLEARGIGTKVAPLLGDEYVQNLYAGRRTSWKYIFEAYLRRLTHVLKSRRFDLIWIEREFFPWLPSWAPLLLSRWGIPYVVDYDDAVFHRYDLHPNGIVRTLLGSKIDVIMRRASLVLAGNDYLAARARCAGARRVEILPSVIDLDRYLGTSKGKNRVFTIGWIGSPATSKYLKQVCPALAHVCGNNKARVTLVGSGQLELSGVPTEIRDWSEDTEVASIRDFDVGIMPLPDEPWTRGKCGYKLIQYMACALPVVASPVGVNRQIIDQGICGYLSTTTEDWVRALADLRDNGTNCEGMGKAGRIKVEKQYCLQVTAPRLLSLLRGVAKRCAD